MGTSCWDNYVNTLEVSGVTTGSIWSAALWTVDLPTIYEAEITPSSIPEANRTYGPDDITYLEIQMYIEREVAGAPYDNFNLELILESAEFSFSYSTNPQDPFTEFLEYYNAGDTPSLTVLSIPVMVRSVFSSMYILNADCSDYTITIHNVLGTKYTDCPGAAAQFTLTPRPY